MIDPDEINWDEESKESYNRGNFKEFYDCLAEHDP
jgi:hypothetical protein